jgi:hypothetical protein
VDVGTLTIRHEGREDVYPLRSADLLAFPTAGGSWLRFEVEAALPNGKRPHSAEVAVLVERLDPDRLVGRRWYVPRGYDPAARQDPVATFDEHLDLDDNELEILCREGAALRVRWTAKVGGGGEGGSPGARIEVDGRFTFRGPESKGGH